MIPKRNNITTKGIIHFRQRERVYVKKEKIWEKHEGFLKGLKNFEGSNL